MSITNEIIIFIIILFTVLILDGIVLKLMNNKWNEAIKNIQGNEIIISNKLFPIVAYILIILGIRIFVLPYFINGDIQTGLLYGFMWGLITYGIFDFTNLSLFKNYPIGLAIFDTLWGGVLAGLTGFIVYHLYTNLMKNKLNIIKNKE